MLPLDGIRVLDLSKLAPGPFCTMILGDFGAEVLNIEAPLGERHYLNVRVQSPYEKTEKNEIFNSLNRNKKSIAINLKRKEGQRIFYELAKAVDVIVEGFRPGVVKRLGIDYETIRAKNSKIIYCSITGYGQRGPYSKLPGHDINYLSQSGALSLIADEDGKPIIPLNLVGDFAGGGLFSVIGILIALFVREKTGIGQYIDISMTNGIISLLTMFFDYYFRTGTQTGPGKSGASGYYPYYNVYETKDQKYISIGCTEPWFWERLCKVLGKMEFAPFHFSASHLFEGEKNEKWIEISEHLREFFRKKTRDQWFEFLANKDIPVGKVLPLSEVSSDSHVNYQEMVIEIDHPTEGRIKQVGIPIKLSRTKGEVRRLGPTFGEHTKEILGKLGYSDHKIRNLMENGIVQ